MTNVAIRSEMRMANGTVSRGHLDEADTSPSEVALRTHVTLPDELVGEIDELVGKRKRSQFIKDAVEERLRRELLPRAFDDVVGSLKESRIPEWATPESSAAWVREQRIESDRIRGANDRLPPAETNLLEEGAWTESSSTHQS